MVRSVVAAVLLSAAVLFSVPSAHANSGELLDFAGLGNLQAVGNFYNGGGLASTPNYGVTFSSNFFGLISTKFGGAGNYNPEIFTGTQTISIPAAIFINGTTGSMAVGVMNVAAGFSNGLNFFYSAGFTGSQAETVTVWSGTNGTGTVLATITLQNNNGGCSGSGYAFCNWSNTPGLSFSGTAHSVTFSGPTNELGIAEITLGSPRTAIPEPSTIYLFGIGLVGVTLGRMRRFFGA
jgi:hypothetical protein